MKQSVQVWSTSPYKIDIILSQFILIKQYTPHIHIIARFISGWLSLEKKFPV